MATMMRKLALGAALALLAGGSATAQWAWRDASGSMVFSDQPPPTSVPAKDIVRRPAPAAGPRYTPPVEPTSEAGAEGKPRAEAPPAPARAAPSVADREIESRRRQQQLAEAQKKAADDEARKAQQAENCERLASYQRALDDGLRVARVNAAGEREILDDAAIAAETARTRRLIEEQCR